MRRRLSRRSSTGPNSNDEIDIELDLSDDDDVDPKLTERRASSTATTAAEKTNHLIQENVDDIDAPYSPPKGARRHPNRYVFLVKGGLTDTLATSSTSSSSSSTTSTTSSSSSPKKGDGGQFLGVVSSSSMIRVQHPVTNKEIHCLINSGGELLEIQRADSAGLSSWFIGDSGRFEFHRSIISPPVFP